MLHVARQARLINVCTLESGFDIGSQICSCLVLDRSTTGQRLGLISSMAYAGEIDARGFYWHPGALFLTIFA